MSKCVSPVLLPVLSTWSSVLVLLGMAGWINNIENCVLKSLPGDLEFLRICKIDCRKPRLLIRYDLQEKGPSIFWLRIDFCEITGQQGAPCLEVVTLSELYWKTSMLKQGNFYQLPCFLLKFFCQCVLLCCLEFFVCFVFVCTFSIWDFSALV